ncbi:MAG TPA: hypothetical protein EYN70_11765, partial [Planctomycetaceae bacterium]|nr:hypothetical protein [Planctomycetaceae bacterium]
MGTMTDRAVNKSSQPTSSSQRNGILPLSVNSRSIGIAWALLVLYLVFFFWSDKFHQAVCWLLLVPDELILQWTGGDWLRLSLLDRLPLLLLASGMILSASALGRLVLRPTGLLGELTRAEGVLFSVAIGLSCLSLCTLALGWAGWLQTGSLFLCLLGAPVLIEVICMNCGSTKPQVVGSTTEGATGSRASGSLSANWLWLLAPLTLIVLLGGMLPPQDFDVREYHLQVPKEWYQGGRIEFLPHNVYGNMPLGAEVLSIPAMAIWPGENGWWWGAMVGKTILASFGLLTTGAIYLFGRRWFSDTAALVAAIVFLATPWVLHVCLNGLVEMAVAFYGLMAVYATLLWRQQPERLAWPGLAGFLAGSAVACKYPAVLLIVFPLLIYLAVHAGRRAPTVILVFTVTVSLACGLWFAKNIVMTGNPTYPLLSDWFGGESRSAERTGQWQRAHQVPRDPAGRRYSVVQLWGSLGQFAGRSRWQSPLLIPLALLGVMWGRRRREVLGLAALIAYTLLAWWLLTHRIERFWVPVLPLLALLAGLGSVQLCRVGLSVTLP